MAHEQLVVYIVEKAKNYFVKVFYIDLFVKNDLTEIYSLLYFDKTFVKMTFLLKKLLNS